MPSVNSITKVSTFIYSSKAQMNALEFSDIFLPTGTYKANINFIIFIYICIYTRKIFENPLL